MTLEGTVIDSGLGSVAVVSVGFTMCTDSVTALKTSKMLGSVSEGAVDEECMAEAK